MALDSVGQGAVDSQLLDVICRSLAAVAVVATSQCVHRVAQEIESVVRTASRLWAEIGPDALALTSRLRPPTSTTTVPAPPTS